MGSTVSEQLIEAARKLGRAVNRLKFAAPVEHVYNPLQYAWAPHENYLRKFGRGPRRVLFLGMNPGPFGMVQTGVPFGEVMAVRDWLGIDGAVGRPATEHPRRIVQGFDCPRSEVSGQRLWGLFAKQFGDSKSFFEEHFVLNYCPLAFLEKSGRNVTPDKLLPVERLALFQRCDEHLASAVTALNPEWLVGIGDFALKRAEQLFGENGPKLGRILHPSPASPAANRDWSGVATRQLKAQGVWR